MPPHLRIVFLMNAADTMSDLAVLARVSLVVCVSLKKKKKVESTEALILHSTTPGFSRVFSCAAIEINHRRKIRPQTTMQPFLNFSVQATQYEIRDISVD